MSKAGKRLLSAAKEALASARCRHKWTVLSTRVENGRVTGGTFLCEKCKTRKTETVLQHA